MTPSPPPPHLCSLPSSTALGLNKQLHLLCKVVAPSSCLHISGSDQRLHVQVCVLQGGLMCPANFSEICVAYDFVDTLSCSPGKTVNLLQSPKLGRRHMPAGRAAILDLQLCQENLVLLSLCRNPELVYLLDGRQFFPAGVFGRNEALLAALQQLGLRSAVTPDTLLDSAHFVEQLSATDEEAAYAR